MCTALLILIQSSCVLCLAGVVVLKALDGEKTVMPAGHWLPDTRPAGLGAQHGVGGKGKPTVIYL